MIDKLIIGPQRRSEIIATVRGEPYTEEGAPDNSHPAAIRRWAHEVHLWRRSLAVCTYSPMVIRAVIEVWDKDPLIPSWIVLRSQNGKDTPLLDVKSPEWLAHFAIEDLYMMHEFDAVLNGDA
jgi:hypothetical protein